MRRAPDPSVPGGGRFEIVIKAPTLGLVTAIPSEQPDARAAVAASNVRFDDGVVRNAPGFTAVVLSANLDTQPNLIFQAEVTPQDGIVPKVSTIMIGTGRYLYALSYLDEDEFPLVAEQTVKFFADVENYDDARRIPTAEIVPPMLFLFSIADRAELWRLRARANTEADDGLSYLLPADWGLTNNVILVRVR